jgi:hypothetical protein
MPTELPSDALATCMRSRRCLQIGSAFERTEGDSFIEVDDFAPPRD